MPSGGLGAIIPASGLVTIKSGHFAAFGGGPRAVTFNAYRDGKLVGTFAAPNLETADTLIKFDKTFSKIDRLEIIGQVAFDDLVFKFDK